MTHACIILSCSIRKVYILRVWWLVVSRVGWEMEAGGKEEFSASTIAWSMCQ